jgi:hypothetical protein
MKAFVRGLQKTRSALVGNYRFATNWITVIESSGVSQFYSAVDNSGVATVGFTGSGSSSGYLVLPVTGQPITKQKIVTTSGGYSPYLAYIQDSSTGYFGGTESASSCIALHKVNLSADTVSATGTALPGTGYSSFAYMGNNKSFGLDSSGNMYCSVYINNTAGSEYRSAILKFNSSGALQWGSVYGRGITNSQTIMYGGTAVASSGNSYHCGVTTNAVSSTGCVIKLNSSGTLQWSYNLTASSYHRYIALDSSENVYIITPSTTSEYYAIIKLDSNGNLVSQRKINSQVTWIYIDQSTNDIYLGGASNTYNSAFVCKYNSSLSLQWQRSITSSVNSLYFTSVSFSNSQLYLGMIYQLVSGGTSKRCIVKIPADGSGTGSFVLDDTTFTYGSSSITESAGSETRSSLTLNSYSVSFSSPTLTTAISNTNFTIGYSPVPA